MFGLNEFAQNDDFLCGDRHGVYSCQPTDFYQLATFKTLQMRLNQVLKYGNLKAPRVVVDGRIGAETVTAARQVAQLVGSRNLIRWYSYQDAKTLAQLAEEIGADLAAYLSAKGVIPATADGSKTSQRQAVVESQPAAVAPSPADVTVTDKGSNWIWWVLGGAAVLLVAKKAHKHRKHRKAHKAHKSHR